MAVLIEKEKKEDLNECAICGCELFHLFGEFVHCANCKTACLQSEVNIKPEWEKRG